MPDSAVNGERDAFPTPISVLGTRRVFGLPPDLLIKARRRATYLSVLVAILFLLPLGIMELLFQTSGVNRTILRIVCFSVAGLSTIYHILTRIKRLNDSLILYAGLVFEVAFCAVISIGVPWFTFSNFGYFPHLTWASCIIIVYPLIIPSPPLATLVTALAAAATSPLGRLVLATVADAPAEAGDYIGACISPTLAVALALFGSRIIYGLNVDLSRARRLGSYELIELLGKGAMGEVWRASHRLLAREAAIKIIKPDVLKVGDMEARQIMRRFEREAQSTASLESPHSIELYDFGTTEGGTFYYVMELLDGLDLQTLVHDFGPQPAGRVVPILVQICHSLADAHSQNLIHRDIKPANIFICRKGLDLDFVKVLDFGLVKSTHSMQVDGSLLTATHTLVGTPAYMAPETIREGQAGMAADLYAVGCVAYWLLTGHVVFEADTTMDLLVQHATAEPIPPSARTEMDIPAEVERIVLACLAKQPEDRPQSATELSGLLNKVANGASQPNLVAQWWDLHHPVTRSNG